MMMITMMVMTKTLLKDEDIDHDDDDKEYDDNTSLQDEEQRQKLNRITHPEIYKEMIWEAVRCFSWIEVLSIASVGYYSSKFD